MLSRIATAGTGLLIAIGAFGQSLTDAQKAIVDATRAKYYSLESLGFQSAACTVNFDFKTLPSLPSEDPAADRRLIEKTIFSLYINGAERTPLKVRIRYPKDASEKDLDRAAGLVSALRFLVQGAFQTWGTKSLHGPLPVSDAQLESVTPSEIGFTIVAGDPDNPLHIELNKSYLVTKIVSDDGKIDERPIYTPTVDGLLYTGAVVTDNSNPNSTVAARYELGSQIVDGFRLPSAVRLQINRNINVRFSLNDCVIRKDVLPRYTPPQE